MSKAAASVRVEVSDELPDGMNVLCVEREGAVVWLVRRGHISNEAMAEMNAGLEHLTGSGLWDQRWSMPGSPHLPPSVN